MKNKYACTIAAAILITIILAVIFNGIFVKRTAENILSILEELPDDTSASLPKIRETAEYWERRRKILNLALSDPELEAISSLFDELIIGAEKGNNEEYKKTMARLKRAIEDIKELEEFSIKNIF